VYSWRTGPRHPVRRVGAAAPADWRRWCHPATVPRVDGLFLAISFWPFEGREQAESGADRRPLPANENPMPTPLAAQPDEKMRSVYPYRDEEGGRQPRRCLAPAVVFEVGFPWHSASTRTSCSFAPAITPQPVRRKSCSTRWPARWGCRAGLVPGVGPGARRP